MSKLWIINRVWKGKRMSNHKIWPPTITFGKSSYEGHPRHPINQSKDLQLSLGSNDGLRIHANLKVVFLVVLMLMRRRVMQDAKPDSTLISKICNSLAAQSSLHQMTICCATSFLHFFYQFSLLSLWVKVSTGRLFFLDSFVLLLAATRSFAVSFRLCQLIAVRSILLLVFESLRNWHPGHEYLSLDRASSCEIIFD